MITVNVWLPTTKLFNKRVTHSYLGPLLASHSDNEHTGHVNFKLEVTEKSQHFNYSQTILKPLQGYSTLKTIAVPVTVRKENHAHLEPKSVQCNIFTLSFWPEHRPSLLRETAQFFFKKAKSFKVKGVKPEFRTHDDDMVLEDTQSTPGSITHKSLRYNANNPINDQLTRWKDELQELWEITEDLTLWQQKLQANLEQKEKLEQDKQSLDANYTQSMQQLTEDLAANATSQKSIQNQLFKKRQIFKYLSSVQFKDESSNQQHQALSQEINKLNKKLRHLAKEEKRLLQIQQDSQKDYESECLKFSLHQQEQDDLQNKIQQAMIKLNGRDEQYTNDLRAKFRQLKERENSLIDNKEAKTIGRHPDYTLSLPVKSANLIFGLDELKIMQALEAEQEQTYSFFVNNCASSVKRCLLAGIDEDLREHLQEHGLTDNFFKLKKVETCNSLLQWAKTLEKNLLELNTSAKQGLFKPVNEQPVKALIKSP